MYILIKKYSLLIFDVHFSSSHALSLSLLSGRRGRDRMVVGYTTTHAMSAYHHRCCEFESLSGRDVQHYSVKSRYQWHQTSLCDKVCQWLATGRWFSPGPPVSSTNKTDHHDITEILLKVVLNTIKQTNKLFLL